MRKNLTKLAISLTLSMGLVLNPLNIPVIFAIGPGFYQLTAKEIHVFARAPKNTRNKSFTVLTTADFNGDGIDDLIMSDGRYNHPNGSSPGEGAVYIYYGKSKIPDEIGLDFEANDTKAGNTGKSYLNDPPYEPDLRFVGRSDMCENGIGVFIQGDRLGTQIATGDINNDGFDDLLIAANKANCLYNGGDFVAAYVVFGQQGLAGTVFLDPTKADLTLHTPNRSTVGGNIGLALGDLNGDGYDDIILGRQAPATGDISGVVHVKEGAASYPSSQIDLDVDYMVLIRGEARGHHTNHFGLTMATGDINNDGIDDLLIGSPAEYVLDDSGNRVNAGAAYLIYGSSDPLRWGWHDELGTFNPTFDTILPRDTNHLNEWAWAADKDRFRDNGPWENSQIEFLTGNQAGFRTLISSHAPTYLQIADPVPMPHPVAGDQFLIRTLDVRYGDYDAVFLGANVDDRFGYDVAIGDLNNDDFDDIIISAGNASPSTTSEESGIIYVFLSPTSGVYGITSDNDRMDVNLVGNSSLNVSPNDRYKQQMVKIVEGAGEGQVREIQTHDADEITVTSNWQDPLNISTTKFLVPIIDLKHAHATAGPSNDSPHVEIWGPDLPANLSGYGIGGNGTLEVADLNLDGYNDILGAHTNTCGSWSTCDQRVYGIFNDGTWTPSMARLEIDLETATNIAVFNGVGASAGWEGYQNKIAMGDFNGDGIAEELAIGTTLLDDFNGDYEYGLALFMKGDLPLYKISVELEGKKYEFFHRVRNNKTTGKNEIGDLIKTKTSAN